MGKLENGEKRLFLCKLLMLQLCHVCPFPCRGTHHPLWGTAQAGRFDWRHNVQRLGEDGLHCPAGKSQPCWSFCRKPTL